MKRIFKLGVILLMALGLVLSFTLPASAQDNGYTKVNTNFNVGPGDEGRKIPRGSVVYYLSNGETEVHGSDKSLLLRSKDSETSLVPTPNGFWKATHLFQVPSESSIIVKGNITEVYDGNTLILTVIDQSGQQPPPPTYSGWIESADTIANVTLDYFGARWTVPVSPPNKTDNAINYIFNSATYGNAIIQPVLEWNLRAHAWSCAAWWVSGGSQFRAYPCNASERDVINGYIVYQSGTTWNVVILNSSTAQQSSLTVSIFGVNSLKLSCALEGYYINGNQDVPGDITFDRMEYKYHSQSINTFWTSNVRSGTGLTGLGVNVGFINPTTATLYTAN